jgi:pimeloyl-ACP methyl ester carboxylesterase
MSNQQTALTKRSIDTPSGRISYTEAGSGPVALFVHGVVLNKHVWRRQLTGLSDTRRCIAVDLLAHGDTEIDPNQDVSVTANANMLCEVLGALKIDKIDLVGNDSGGGIAQIFAASNPDRRQSDLSLAAGAGTGLRAPRERIGPGHRNLFAAPRADRTAYTRSSALRGGFR